MIDPIHDAELKFLFDIGLNLELIKNSIISKFLNQIAIIKELPELQNFLHHLTNMLKFPCFDESHHEAIENRHVFETEVHHVVEVKQNGKEINYLT